MRDRINMASLLQPLLHVAESALGLEVARLDEVPNIVSRTLRPRFRVSCRTTPLGTRLPSTRPSSSTRWRLGSAPGDALKHRRYFSRRSAHCDLRSVRQYR